MKMSKDRDIAACIRGPLVPVMPTFGADEALDIESTCRWIDGLIGRGIRLFWTTYGTSHFIAFTDDEIVELTRAAAGVTRGRATFIASTPYHPRKNSSVTLRVPEVFCGSGWKERDGRWNRNRDRYRNRVSIPTPIPMAISIWNGSRPQSGRQPARTRQG